MTSFLIRASLLAFLLPPKREPVFWPRNEGEDLGTRPITTGRE